MSRLTIGDLDDAPCGFLTFTDSGTIKSVNHTLISLLGFGEKSALEGQPIEILFTLATRIFYQTHFFPLLSLHGAANEIFLSLKKKDGETIPIMCNAVRKEQDGQTFNHCVLILIKERGKYEQEILKAKREAEEALKENKELIQAKKDLESYSIDLDRRIHHLAQVNEDVLHFSKVATHDLQEPIRKIAIWADMMLAKGKDALSEKMLKDLNSIHRECSKLRDLTVNLEKFISLNIESEEPAQADLNKLIEKAFAKAVAQSGQSDIRLAPDALPPIEGYVSQIELLFDHLFRNFIRFRDGGHPLTITIGHTIIRSNSYAVIKGKFRYIDMLKIVLADNGGLAEKSRDYVLLMNSRSNIKSIDTDFGFASCRKIASNHYGNISAMLDEEHVTRIVLFLPLHQSRVS